MDTLIIILNFAAGLCLNRHNLGLSTDASNSIEELDLKYQALLDKIADRDAIPTLNATASFFGRINALYFGLFFLSALFKLNNPLWIKYVSVGVIISGGLFISIKWFTQPKQFALQFFIDYTKLFSAFFLFAMIDWLAETNLTWAFYELFNKILAAIQLPLPVVSHPILMALIMFGIIEVILLLFCVISTIIFAPVAFFALVAVITITRVSRLINKHFSENPLQGTCFILFVATFCYQLYSR